MSCTDIGQGHGEMVQIDLFQITYFADPFLPPFQMCNPFWTNFQ
jgi:hypothetical protein